MACAQNALHFATRDASLGVWLSGLCQHMLRDNGLNNHTDRLFGCVPGFPSWRLLEYVAGSVLCSIYVCSIYALYMLYM